MNEQLAQPNVAERVTSFHDMIGKTIRWAEQSPCGEVAADAVIVFEDGCWAALFTEADGCCGEDGASLSLENWSRDCAISDVLSPREMLEAGVINDAQRAWWTEHAQAKERAKAAKQALRLRAQAERLERSARAA